MVTQDRWPVRSDATNDREIGVWRTVFELTFVKYLTAPSYFFA